MMTIHLPTTWRAELDFYFFPFIYFPPTFFFIN